MASRQRLTTPSQEGLAHGDMCSMSFKYFPKVKQQFTLAENILIS